MMRRVVAVALTLLALPLAAQNLVPPSDEFGFTPGDDRRLIDYAQLTGYLERIAAASPRLELREVGRSPLGRPMFVLFVSSPDNLARLDELREINRALALDPDLGDERRARLLADGRAFVLMTLSMHSGEVAPSQALPLFAWEVATSDDPDLAARLDDVVLMFVPCHNPDGMDMVVEHYRKTLGTPHEGSSLPGLYHKYVGHDNNRDFLTLTQEDTRVINRLYSTEWFPQVLVEKHQMGATGPRYFVPANHDPIAENVDEGLWTWSALFGAALQHDMTADAHSGVVNRWLFDNYWPGSTETSLWKNVISFLTEAASCRTATPVYVEPTELTVRGKGLSEYAKTANMPDPWPGGWWRLGDIVDYELSSMRSILATASRHREAILRYRNDLCRKEVERGRTEAPFYWAFPPQQNDRGAVPALVALLEEHGVQVSRLGAEVVVAGRHLPAGTVVVPMAQPFRAFVKEVLEVQRYPERHYTPGGELIRPYDITSWSLPLHWGVETIRLDTRSAELEAVLEPVAAAALAGPPTVPPAAGDAVLAYPPGDNASYTLAFAALAEGLEVQRTTAPLEHGGSILDAGTFLLRSDPRTAAKLREVVAGAAVAPVELDGSVEVPTIRLRAPRIGLVESWFHHMESGWTRYLLDRSAVPYTVVRPGELADADLPGRFDVLVLPSEGVDLLVKGMRTRGDRYFPSDLPLEYRKGMGEKGLVNLSSFVLGGGTVVAWGESVGLFTEGLKVKLDDKTTDPLPLPLRDLTDAAEKSGLFVPGALLAVRTVHPSHPLAWGLPSEVGVFSRGEPVLATSLPVLDTDRRVVMAHAKREVLVSGYLEGEEAIANTPALVWVRAGKGQLVLSTFHPQFRASMPGTFKVLYNALLLPPVVEGS